MMCKNGNFIRERMKKFIYCALIALITISCQKDEEPWENSFVIPQTLSAYTPELDSPNSDSKGRALCEDQVESWDEANAVNSRTYAEMENTSEYIQYWSTSDAISVFFTTANLKYQLSDFVDEDKDGKAEKITLGIVSMTQDEREILLSGGLINYYSKNI